MFSIIRWVADPILVDENHRLRIQRDEARKRADTSDRARYMLVSDNAVLTAQVAELQRRIGELTERSA